MVLQQNGPRDLFVFSLRQIRYKGLRQLMYYRPEQGGVVFCGLNRGRGRSPRCAIQSPLGQRRSYLR